MKTRHRPAARITLSPDSGDCTPRLRAALRSCGEGSVLELQPGDYHFWPNEAEERHCFISNNWHGLKRIAFPIFDRSHLVIEGNGARLLFHGKVLPFALGTSSDITIRNLSVDWVRPFYSQGTVVCADAAGVNVAIDKTRYPYRVEGGRLVFEGEGWQSPLIQGVFAFNPATRAPAYLSGDSMGLGFPPFITAESVDDKTIRLREKFPALPASGDVLVFRHYRRKYPGVFLFQSKRVRLENITLHHAGAMGVIAQFCEDVSLDRCRITPSGDRLFSMVADAAHFVNCRGLISIKDCLFENQLDDALNVHGINYRVHRVLGPRAALVERVHPDQHGILVGFAGDRVLFSNNETLLGYAENAIAETVPLNARFCEVRFAEDIPAALCPNHVVENLSWTANLHMRGCTARRNRARGLLISTPGKVVIENNNISAPGSAIKISGDANFWFESGRVRDVSIRNNRFGDCCFSSPEWGRSVISIDPEIEPKNLREACFHHNIRIEGNTFSTFDLSLLFARSVDGLTFTGNRVRRTRAYPQIQPNSDPVRLEGCRNTCVSLD